MTPSWVSTFSLMGTQTRPAHGQAVVRVKITLLFPTCVSPGYFQLTLTQSREKSAFPNLLQRMAFQKSSQLTSSLISICRELPYARGRAPDAGRGRRGSDGHQQ